IPCASSSRRSRPHGPPPWLGRQPNVSAAVGSYCRSPGSQNGPPASPPAARQLCDRATGAVQRRGEFGVPPGPRCREGARQRFAARIVDCDIASDRAGGPATPAGPERADPANACDASYDATSTALRSQGNSGLLDPPRDQPAIINPLGAGDAYFGPQSPRIHHVHAAEIVAASRP